MRARATHLRWTNPHLLLQVVPAHGLTCCEARVEISVNPVAAWTGAVVGGDLDNAVEKIAHVALTAMCEQRLSDTADIPITLFPKKLVAQKKVGSHTLKHLTPLLQVLYLHSRWQSIAGMITSRAWDDGKLNLFCSGDKV
jgi:hypothetical protein